MDLLVISLFLIIHVFYINAILPPEKREELLNKYTKKISYESFYSPQNRDNFNDLQEDRPVSIKYNVEAIKGILKILNLNESFNFLEHNDISPNIKDQKKCGCSWAHASTTALSYRFKLKGIDVDLSPQDALSCYIRDCNYSNYLIDSQLNLIKNGTVTEKCLPFSSGDGTIKAECPKTKCQDGSAPKRYYSQNAYTTEGLSIKDDYNNIVTLILDQLKNRGPFVSDIMIFEDFEIMHKDKAKCHDTIYRYDGKSEYHGEHAVTIVGYGFTNNKFYWLAQNSWGKDSCLDGFVKIEFGQIGIETISFSEPYIEPEEGKNPQEVKLKYNKINEKCTIDITSETDVNIWKNTIEFSFESDDGKDNFNIQCGYVPLKNLNPINCNYELAYLIRPKQTFKFKKYQSLGKDNTFNLGESSANIKNFTFFGVNNISAGFLQELYFYVSEEGSKIILYFDEEDVGKNYLPPIYSNYKQNTPLSDCKRKILYNHNSGNVNLIICELKSNEIDYFDNYTESNRNSVLYGILCGKREKANIYVYKYDKTKYPIFRIEKANLEITANLSEQTNFSLVATIDGPLPEGYQGGLFMAYVNIEFNGVNETYVIQCDSSITDMSLSEHNLKCALQIMGEVEYDNLYILPYTIPVFPSFPLEIIIKGEIKKENKANPKPVENIAKNMRISFMNLLRILFLL